ncbi:MAG TPA: adenylate/guanylate cyclase domain-containing protein [Stellaceae bacterium]|nr:adenylate/guanylate cyclase domain-containing protein [Stellaceae bacterium]
MSADKPERTERRLAAILAADIAGYSRLMGADEEGTLAALKAIRAELGDPKIAEHRGRIVKTTGDGMLVEFQSVVDAVRCAVALQQGMAAHNVDIPAERRIEFRIGINLGDIIGDAGDIYGDGVNIAARLEALAEPGGICVSRVVHDQVRDKLAVAFDDQGEQQVKNIARPVHVYRVRTGGPAPVTAPLPLPDKPSLAVLPFQNMSGDPEQEYFADGMVEEITTAIARLPWLFVIARNSSFTYKGRAVDVKQVARELGVRYVLEGSVRKAGNRVRITGQLIDTSTGAHIWADRFDGALDDIFDLQDQVASSVVGAIEPRLRQSEIDRAHRKPTENLDAYDLYLRALAEFYRYSEDGFAEAAALLQRALATDPAYAPPAALIGMCRVLQRLNGWGALSDLDVTAALSLARQALDHTRDDPEVMAHAAWTLFYLAGETSLVEAALDRALALNANASIAWHLRGAIHAWRIRPELAIDALDRALRLSPFDPLTRWSAAGVALAHLGARRFQQSLEWADRALHDQPRLNPAMRLKIAALAHLGRLDEARGELARLLAFQPGLTIAGWRAFTTPGAAPEIVELWAEGLRRAGLPEA